MSIECGGDQETRSGIWHAYPKDTKETPPELHGGDALETQGRKPAANASGQLKGPAPTFPERARFFRFNSEAGNVLGLQTLRALADLEFHGLSFIEGLVPFRLNRGKVHEHILTGLTGDEPVAF